MTHRHPVNREMIDQRTRADAAIGRLVGAFGSLPYITWQTVIVLAWVTVNTLQVTGRVHFDPYPYILLNLAFSTQASYAAPLILLAQNRQDKRDRLKAEHDYGVNETALGEIRATRELALEVRGLATEIHQLTVAQMSDLAGVSQADAKLDLVLRAVLPPQRPASRPRSGKKEAP